MSLLVLSHFIQLAALSSVGVLNVILAAVLGGTAGLFAGAATGLAVFHEYLNGFATIVQHPWVVGRVAWVAAVLVAMGGVRQHLKRTAR
ncbi:MULTISPECIES: hypothetical protein [Burkholderia]|uniref:hypothetical protein n=1 Tax=Burkholderia TaxID=32008 RepID=UPI00163FE060|nr:hypothetical protein [Burkholderia gladioli]